MPPSLTRLLLTALLLSVLSGCMSRGIPQPVASGEQAEARQWLQRSAEAHGLAAYRQLSDVSVSYAGEWAGLVSRLQPTLIDTGFRQGSQERLILKGSPRIAQQHTGPQGTKQVVRSTAGIQVYYNGVASDDRDVLDAAALVADGYRMFLTGPFYFLEGNLSLEVAADETVDERPCISLVAVRRPGHGRSPEDRYQLFIDRENHILRRVRFTMEGFAPTQGAIAEVDFFDHRQIAGVTWPIRFHERLHKPIPGLPVHDWRLTGLDVQRDMKISEIDGQNLTGKAAEPARALDRFPASTGQ